MSILKKLKPNFLLNLILIILLFPAWSVSAFADLSPGSDKSFFYEGKIDETEAFHLDSLNPTENENIAFGIKAGINLANMNFNKGHRANADYINPTWKVGFFAGVAIQIPLPRRFSLTQEYLLSRTRGQYIPSESIYTLDYLSIFLLLRYSFHKRFSIVTGPQFELLILGKENSGSQVRDITKITEERSVGWAFGVQYSIIPRFFFEARFMKGINAIGINQRSNINEFRFELFQISCNYVFK